MRLYRKGFGHMMAMRRNNKDVYRTVRASNEPVEDKELESYLNGKRAYLKNLFMLEAKLKRKNNKFVSLKGMNRVIAFFHDVAPDQMPPTKELFCDWSQKVLEEFKVALSLDINHREERHLLSKSDKKLSHLYFTDHDHVNILTVSDPLFISNKQYAFILQKSKWDCPDDPFVINSGSVTSAAENNKDAEALETIASMYFGRIVRIEKDLAKELASKLRLMCDNCPLPKLYNLCNVSTDLFSTTQPKAKLLYTLLKHKLATDSVMFYDGQKFIKLEEIEK